MIIDFTGRDRERFEEFSMPTADTVARDRSCPQRSCTLFPGENSIGVPLTHTYGSMTASDTSSNASRSKERKSVRLSTWPWLLLVLATLAAFLSGPTGDEVGQRVMLLLIAAALIAAIQQRTSGRTRRSDNTRE